MSQNLFVSVAEVKRTSRIDLNVDDNIVRELILLAQDGKLRDILQENLYNQLTDAYNDFFDYGTAVPSNLRGLIDRCKKYLTYQVVCDFIYTNYKFTNKGVFYKSDNNGSIVNVTEYDRTFYDKAANTYKVQLISFLEDNGLLTKESDTQLDGGIYYNFGDCDSNSSFGGDSTGNKIEETDPVWNSEKSNYYTSTQVDQLIGSMSVAAPSLHSVTSVGNTTSNSVYINGTFSAGFDYGNPRLYIDETSFVIDTGQSTIYSYKAFNNIDSS